VHAQKTELPELRPDRLRQRPVLEVAGDVRQELLAHVLANGVANQTFLVVEQTVERERIARIERGKRGGGGGHHCSVELG
jgi:hypothetical protein